jgi:hypothetical protein
MKFTDSKIHELIFVKYNFSELVHSITGNWKFIDQGPSKQTKNLAGRRIFRIYFLFKEQEFRFDQYV